MSVEAAEFTITGRVSKAPMEYLHGFGNNQRKILQLDVTVTRYNKDGKASASPFTVEAWSEAAKQAITRVQPRVGDMVRITGKITNFRNASKKTDRIFENVCFYASTVDDVNVAPDLTHARPTGVHPCGAAPAGAVQSPSEPSGALQGVPQQTAGQRMQEQRARMQEYQQQGAANNGGTYTPDGYGGTYQRGRSDVPPTGSDPEELGYGSRHTSRGYMGSPAAQTEQLEDEDIPF